jgi:23S rRNA pseudouridine2605 synthase
MSIRINKFVAQATGLSRRRADQLISEGRIIINGRPAKLGDVVIEEDQVSFSGQALELSQTLTIMLNKPVGYVCSRQGQGSQTVYDLLPSNYADLKPVGRLDKDSSGLLLLTNDGNLALSLTHPRYVKEKIYEVGLDKPLMPGDLKLLNNKGVRLSDGLSKLKVSHIKDNSWQVTMHEGRNRQIRRTFEALGYQISTLHRLQIGQYVLGDLASGEYKEVAN